MSHPASAPNLHTDWPFPVAQADWAQPPPAVQAYLATLPQALDQLKQRVEALEARLHTTSETSSRPPSSASPFRKGRNKRDRLTGGRPGANPGHPGVRQTWLSPTSTAPLRPTECRCGNRAFVPTAPYYTHQVIALPPLHMDSTHWGLHQADCPRCGQRVKAQLPPEPHTGYGPRLSALSGAMAGGQGPSRSLMQTCCASGRGVPIGLGAIQTVLNRVPLAIQPHYEAIAHIARQAPGNDIDAPPWGCHGTRQWLWGMASPQAAV